MTRVLHLIYRGFNAVTQPLGWFLFLGGLMALALTWPVHVLPPFNDDPRNILITCVGWLLVALEGFGIIQEET